MLPSTENVLGLALAITSPTSAAKTIFELIEQDQKGYVCVASVHTCMLAHENKETAQACARALFTVPDGKPLAWTLKRLGHNSAQQTRGLDLTLALLNMAELNQLRVGFYGSHPQTLAKLATQLQQSHPKLNICYSHAPSFKPLSEMTSTAEIDAIQRANLQLLFVGLGSPKQEQWMMQHGHLLPGIQISVGAVFDFLAGTQPIAPSWMIKAGLEWLHRLYQEPRRLAHRYLVYNSKFLVYVAAMLIRKRYLHHKKAPH